MNKVISLVLCVGMALSVLFGELRVPNEGDIGSVSICCDEEFIDVRQ